MAPSQDIEVKGVTTFTSSPTTSYRYVIQLKDEKTSIWMEDRVSKKQWYKGDMTKADYVTSANTITDASAAEYIMCFKDAVDCDLEGVDDVQRELEVVKGGGIQLTLAVAIRVLRSTRVAKFTFNLDPVSVERIDVLESKLRDQQEELKRLREEFDAGQVLPSAQLTASTSNTTTSNLIWDRVEAEHCSVDEEKELVKILRPGLYNISVMVSCCPINGRTVSLVKNGDRIQDAFCTYARGEYSSTSLNSTLRLEKDDQLSVKCSCNVGGTSYLFITQLGR